MEQFKLIFAGGIAMTAFKRNRKPFFISHLILKRLEINTMERDPYRPH